MAEIYKFFNSAPGDRRTYQAADFASYFGSVLSTGFLHTNKTPGMEARVETGTLNTIVSAGKAIMKGYAYENTADLTLTHVIPEPDADRIDRIVLRLDLRNSERTIKLAVKQGTSGPTPEPPALQRDNFIYELSVARIRVRKNTVQLLAEDLVDERLIESVGGLVSSLITVPTEQFQRQWDEFLQGVIDEGFAPVSYVDQKITETRGYIDGKAWQKHKLTQDTGFATQINGQNLDNIRTSGYYVGDNVTNAPSASWYMFEVIVFSGVYVKQIAYNLFTNTYQMRTGVEKLPADGGFTTVYSPWTEDLFTSVVNGKNGIASAIIGKGGTASGSDSFAQLAAAITALQTELKIAMGVNPSGTIANLPFRPLVLILDGYSSVTATDGNRAQATGSIGLYKIAGYGEKLSGLIRADLRTAGTERAQIIEATNTVFGSNFVTFQIGGTGAITGYTVMGV